jgi:hypothetical protein
MLTSLLGLVAMGHAAPLPQLTPARTGATAPKDGALIIGIEDYMDLADVPYAERDAQAFYDFLVYTRGVSPDRIEKLTNPSKEKIEKAAGRIAAEPGGIAWVYYAGHGAASTTVKELVLLGRDTPLDVEVYETRTLTVSSLARAAAATKAEVMMVMDTCYAGAGRAGHDLFTGTRFAVPAYAVDEPSVTLWTAAAPNQLAEPLDEVQHGAFTYFAIGALRGWADGELSGTADGKVTLDEANLYVQRALRNRGIRQQQSQVTGEGGLVVSRQASEPDPLLVADTPSESPVDAVVAIDPPPTPPQPVPSQPVEVPESPYVKRLLSSGRDVPAPWPATLVGENWPMWFGGQALTDSEYFVLHFGGVFVDLPSQLRWLEQAEFDNGEHSPSITDPVGDAELLRDEVLADLAGYHRLIREDRMAKENQYALWVREAQRIWYDQVNVLLLDLEDWEAWATAAAMNPPGHPSNEQLRYAILEAEGLTNLSRASCEAQASELRSLSAKELKIREEQGKNMSKKLAQLAEQANKALSRDCVRF